MFTAATTSAQDAVVEWMEFDGANGRSLVLNAYEVENGSVGSAGAVKAPLDLEPEDIAALVVDVPMNVLPVRSSRYPFLRVLGLGDLDELAEKAPEVAGNAPGSSDFALWAGLVTKLLNESELQIGGRAVRTKEVAEDLRRVYAAQGHPSPEEPVLPHLVRGVVAVYDENGRIAESIRALEIGAIEYGAIRYAPLTFRNLGSRPARLHSGGGLFYGASLGNADAVIAPGNEAGRLLRFKLGLGALLRGGGSANLTYSSEGEHRRIAQLHGTLKSSAARIVYSTARSQFAAHLGYWRDVRLYRYALLIVGFGALGLFAAVAFAKGAAVLRRSRRTPFEALQTLAASVPASVASVRARAVSLSRYIASIAALSTSVREHIRDRPVRTRPAKGDPKPRTQSENPVREYGALSTRHSLLRREVLTWARDRLARYAAAVMHAVVSCLHAVGRLAKSIRIPTPVVSTGLGLKLSRFGSGLNRAASRVAAVPRRRFSLGIVQDREPVNARECFERLQRFAPTSQAEIGSPSSNGLTTAEVRREAVHLARRLDASLKGGHLPPAIEHFQMLWALRLLAAVLDRGNSDAHSVLDQWLSGAKKVIEHRCREGVGPTTAEFMELARELEL